MPVEHQLVDGPLAQMRTKLEAMREELQALTHMAAESASTVELDQSRVGRLSRMDALAGQAMSQETRRRRLVLLQQVAAALKKLDRGEYGECDECLEPINPQRLALHPAAPLCISCAAAAESR